MRDHRRGLANALDSMPPMNDELRSALRDADWEILLPSLVGYAARRLRRAGWGAGRDEEPSRLSVEQLVQTAVEHCLDGTRTWDSSAVDLGGFLRGVIRSLTSSERKKHVRAPRVVSDGGLEQEPSPAGNPESEAIEEEARSALLSSFAEAARGDPDLEALYATVLDGATKREDIAAALGWDPARVSAARIKLQRRLEKRWDVS